jgi:hypothetical protein
LEGEEIMSELPRIFGFHAACFSSTDSADGGYSKPNKPIQCPSYQVRSNWKGIALSLQQDFRPSNQTTI